ncbi:MAG: PKD domain-containing protein [Bacteroidota bacterium]
MDQFVRLMVLLLTCSSIAFAQPTYTANDYAAQGDTFIVSRLTINLTGLDFAATGTNTTWDYSSIQPNAQDVVRFLDPADAGYRFAYITNCVLNGGNPFTCPGQFDDLTNLALQTFDGGNLGLDNVLPVGISNVVRHFNKSSGQLEETILGISAGISGAAIPVPIEFTRPDTLLRFPLTFGTTDSAESEFGLDLTGIGAPVAFEARQKRVNTVEGWGSITTPLQTYPNALKVKTLIFNDDSVTINGTTAPGSQGTQVFYSWYVPGVGIPVLEASGTVVLGAELITQIDFLDTLRCIEPNALYVNFPLAPVIDQSTGDVTVSFTNLSSNADSYEWSFGDGGSSTDAAPQHTYTAGGLYQVELIACNTGCQPAVCDTLRLPLLVVDSSGVAAAFNYDPFTPCQGDTVAFDNFSFNANTYDWDFGDGTTSTAENPTHIFAAGGNYPVQLIASGNGNSDTLIRVVSVSSPPTVDLGTDQSIGVNGSVQLGATTSGGNLTYTWNFAAGLSCYFCPNPVASPSVDQTYILTVTNSCGNASDTILVDVDSTIGIGPPLVSVLDITVFPNPTSHSIELLREAPTRIDQVWSWQMLDIKGRVIARGDWRTDRISLDMADWPTGLYYLYVRSEEAVFNEKIYKQ